VKLRGAAASEAGAKVGLLLTLLDRATVRRDVQGRLVERARQARRRRRLLEVLLVLLPERAAGTACAIERTALVHRRPQRRLVLCGAAEREGRLLACLLSRERGSALTVRRKTRKGGVVADRSQPEEGARPPLPAHAAGGSRSARRRRRPPRAGRQSVQAAIDELGSSPNHGAAPSELLQRGPWRAVPRGFAAAVGWHA